MHRGQADQTEGRGPPGRRTVGRLVGPDGQPLTEAEMFAVGPEGTGSLSHRSLSAEGLFWFGAPEAGPWQACVSVLRSDGVYYRQRFHDLRPGEEVLELHVTGARSLFLRLHPAGCPDEELLVDEYFIHDFDHHGIGHCGPPPRSGGLMYWWERAHPPAVIENAILTAPGYRTVELGRIDLSKGVVVLDVELEPDLQDPPST